MRILHYVDENRLAWGETWIQLIRELSRQNVSNYVVCKSEGTLAGRLREEGLAFDTCDVPVACLPWTAPKLGRLITQFKPDIIHTRLSSAARIGGWWGKRLGVPVVATIDKYPKAYYYKNAAMIIPCSSAVKDHMSRLGFKDDMMLVIHNPVDNARYLRDARVRAAKREELGVRAVELMILAAGRFVDWKGFEYAIEAYSLFLKQHQEYCGSTRLCVVGDGPEKQKYAALISSLGMQESVKLYPFAQDIRPWLWAADLFIQPSQEPEGFSLMLLEAMAAGVPAIATDIGGTTDIIKDGENGWLTGIKDYKVLSEKIFTIVSCRDLLERTSAAACDSAALFNVTDIAARTISCYAKILQQKGRCR